MDNYQTFIGTLQSTGNSFAVSMEHRAFNALVSSEMMNNSSISYASVYLNTYTNSILDTLRSGHIYKLDMYDYFYVTVKNTNRTQASIMNGMIADDKSNFKIGCAYGGVVWASRDE